MTRPMWSRTATILAAGLICAGPALTTATPSRAAGQRPAARGMAEARAMAAARDIAAARGMAAAAPGSNLLANGGAEAGAVSGQGWDSVTIPGWHVRRGLPTVVRYGTRGFPGRADAGTRGRGRQLFAGGAGGTAELIQRIPLRTAAGKAAPSGSRFRLSAWLGGTRTAVAELRVRFFSAAGKLLGARRWQLGAQYPRVIRIEFTPHQATGFQGAENLDHRLWRDHGATSKLGVGEPGPSRQS